MNSFYNPAFISKILKSYFLDIGRLKRLKGKDLRKYQDKSLRKIVKFAYTVPLYHDKYKKAGVRPEDVAGIQDISKLPMISKEDIKNYYPDGIISSKTCKEKLIEISTSGTTGKSLSLYGDMYDAILWLFWYVRILREYGIKWRKNRMTVIGDFAPHTIGTGYIVKGLLSNLKNNFLFNNIQWLDTNDEPKTIIKEVNRFKPEFIGGYVGMLGHLALLKEEGYGESVNPRCIATIGSVLTDPLKKLLEESFDACVFEVYGATESGTIAYQCKYGRYHVMSDLVHLEFLKDGLSVSSKEPGELILTKLYGGGTPIIRYDAVNDIIAPLYGECDCGMSGDLIDRIYGRDDLSLYFSGGRALLPSSISEIHGRILYGLKTNKVKETRIIQHSLTKIEIKLVIDNELREKGPSIEKIFSIIKNGYREKVGSDVEIIVREVDRVGKKGPRIISKLDRNKFEIRQYI